MMCRGFDFYINSPLVYQNDLFLIVFSDNDGARPTNSNDYGEPLKITVRNDGGNYCPLWVLDAQQRMKNWAAANARIREQEAP